MVERENSFIGNSGNNFQRRLKIQKKNQIYVLFLNFFSKLVSQVDQHPQIGTTLNAYKQSHNVSLESNFLCSIGAEMDSNQLRN